MDRPALSFTLRGFSERDTLLFRSFVSIISHRSSYRWVWQEPSRGPGVDLLVLRDGVVAQTHDATSTAAATVLARQVLLAAPGGDAGRDVLSLPLRAEAILAHFERLGHVLTGVQESAWAQREALLQSLHQARLQLLRWPPAQLLTTSDHTRMATLLTVQPATLAALCRHSGVALDTGAAFIEQLHAEGLLQLLHAKPPPPAAAPAKGGLLASIRRRLGI